MISLDKEYQLLLLSILNRGVEKTDRTGTGTKSIFGYQFRHNMKDGFPILTTKKIHFKSVVTELLWFLRGDTNIKYLVDNGCNIWNGDAYKAYKTKYGYDDIDSPLSMGEFITKIKTDNEFAKENGDLGPIYGQMWRDWDEDTGVKIDQIQNLINDIKSNPDSRRLMVNAWNPTYIQHMVLPPCHYGFQVYTRELTEEEQFLWVIKNTNVELENVYIVEEIAKPTTPTRAISLMWNQRSVDTFLGLPFNIASYGLLLEIIAKEVNMVPDELIGNLGDCHLYLNHLEQAKDQVTREPFELPKLGMDYREGEYNKNLTDFVPDDFYLINYQSHPSIKAPLNN